MIQLRIVELGIDELRIIQLRMLIVSWNLLKLTSEEFIPQFL
tara:strand:- start:19298 stop:19423 length:126 start_codon:yes stop_codon:yes gene_type:complete